MEINELIDRLRHQIGDIDLENPNITDEELERILEDSAAEYSRLKAYIKFDETQTYDPNNNVYNAPEDSIKIKNVVLKSNPNYSFDFIDNLDQIILNNQFNVDSDQLKITYIRFFKPSDIDLREIDLYLMYAEALCYKLMASKTAELIKFSTGEKMFDESLVSDKFRKLYEDAVKQFKKVAIKSYGKRANYVNFNFDYNLPYPPKGEEL